MPNKKAKTSKGHSSGHVERADTRLVGAARSIGSSLGTVAAKAEGAAKDIEEFTQAVRKNAASKTNKIYKRVKKGVRAGAATWKAGKKKPKASKRVGKKSPGRRK